MIKFDHTAETLQESMSIGQDRADALTASLFYEMINVQQLVNSLFDNPDDAPANLTTKTGVLERALEETKTQEEMVYVTWEYAKYDILIKKDKEFAMGHKLMSLSLFMASNQDKDRFIEIYVKKKSQADSERDDENED